MNIVAYIYITTTYIKKRCFIAFLDSWINIWQYVVVPCHNGIKKNEESQKFVEGVEDVFADI